MRLETSDIISIANSVLILFGFIFAAFEISQNSKIHRENLDWQRKVLTVEALSKRTDMDFLGTLETFDLKNRAEPIAIEELELKFSEQPALESGVIRYLNYQSSLALNAERNIYDREMVVTARGSIIAMSVIRFENFINQRREKTGKNGLWAGLEKFASGTATYKKYKKSRSGKAIEDENEDGYLDEELNLSTQTGPR